LALTLIIKEWDKALIQEACARELSRGGQVYVLHNEVKTIQKITDELSGQIMEIGFSLYNELLERAVKALKRGDLPAEDGHAPP